jgi:hypothetical protein
LAAGDAGALAALSQRHNAPVAAVILDRGPPTRPGRSDGTIQGVEVLYWSKTTGAQSLKRTFTDRTLITTANAIAQALLEQIISPEPPDAPAPTAAASAAPEDPAKPPPASAPSIDPSPASATTPSPAPAPSTSPDEAALPQIIRPFAYDIGSVEDWRRLRARLEAIPDLVFTPSLITTERIVGQLHYSGQSDALMALLAAAGLAKSPAPVPEPVLPPVLATSPPLVADAAPLPAPAEERAEPESGSFAVHLVSTRSEAEAVLEWGRLYQRFPEILASRTPVYRSVDLGADRGVWWRLGVAGFTGRRDAEAWCARLAAVNQHCRVAAQ